MCHFPQAAEVKVLLADSGDTTRAAAAAAAATVPRRKPPGRPKGRPAGCRSPALAAAAMSQQQQEAGSGATVAGASVTTAAGCPAVIGSGANGRTGSCSTLQQQSSVGDSVLSDNPHLHLVASLIPSTSQVLQLSKASVRSMVATRTGSSASSSAEISAAQYAMGAVTTRSRVLQTSVSTSTTAAALASPRTVDHTTQQQHPGLLSAVLQGEHAAALQDSSRFSAGCAGQRMEPHRCAGVPELLAQSSTPGSWLTQLPLDLHAAVQQQQQLQQLQQLLQQQQQKEQYMQQCMQQQWLLAQSAGSPPTSAVAIPPADRAAPAGQCCTSVPGGSLATGGQSAQQLQQQQQQQHGRAVTAPGCRSSGSAIGPGVAAACQCALLSPVQQQQVKVVAITDSRSSSAALSPDAAAGTSSLVVPATSSNRSRSHLWAPSPPPAFDPAAAVAAAQQCMQGLGLGSVTPAAGWLACCTGVTPASTPVSAQPAAAPAAAAATGTAVECTAVSAAQAALLLQLLQQQQQQQQQQLVYTGAGGAAGRNGPARVQTGFHGPSATDLWQAPSVLAGAGVASAGAGAGADGVCGCAGPSAGVGSGAGITAGTGAASASSADDLWGCAGPSPGADGVWAGYDDVPVSVHQRMEPCSCWQGQAVAADDPGDVTCAGSHADLYPMSSGIPSSRHGSCSDVPAAADAAAPLGVGGSPANCTSAAAAAAAALAANGPPPGAAAAMVSDRSPHSTAAAAAAAALAATAAAVAPAAEAPSHAAVLSTDADMDTDTDPFDELLLQDLMEGLEGEGLEPDVFGCEGLADDVVGSLPTGGGDGLDWVDSDPFELFGELT